LNPRYSTRPRHSQLMSSVSSRPRRGGHQATKHRLSIGWRILQALALNWKAFYTSLLELLRAPVSSLLICGVIGIAMALPAGLYMLVKNADSISRSLPRQAQITLFMRPGSSYFHAQRVAQKIGRSALVGKVRAMSPDDALAEYKKITGTTGSRISDELKNLLPAVIVVSLKPGVRKPEVINEFTKKLQKLGQIDSIHLDKTMLRKLYKLVEIGHRATVIIGGILALGVILIVGNTIRLEIQNKHDEIIIFKLIGATNAYVRRPFLFSGAWYGMFGGLFAWLITSAGIMYLSKPVAEFASLSGSNFRLLVPDWSTIGILVGLSTLLGLIGSWVSVSRHLAAIEPT